MPYFILLNCSRIYVFKITTPPQTQSLLKGSIAILYYTLRHSYIILMGTIVDVTINFIDSFITFKNEYLS